MARYGAAATATERQQGEPAATGSAGRTAAAGRQGAADAGGAARTTQSASLSVTAVPAHAVPAEVLRSWEELYEAQPVPANPFLAPTWVLQWYAKFVPARDRLLLVVRRGGSDDTPGPVVGIAPLHVHRLRVGPVLVARRLLPVGAGLGPTPYEIPGLLCAAGSVIQVARAVTRECLRRDVHWAELALTEDQGWFDGDWVADPDSAATFAEFARPRACIVLPLEPTWEATRATLKRNIKESIRRSGNRLKKDGRPFEVRRRGEDLDRAAVERFLTLHQARAELERATDKHHPDAYRDERHRLLMLDALPELGRAGRASMFELYLDGEHVASQLALHAPGASYVHSSGFREDTWALGVVTHLQAELVRHATERGDTVVNFSPGPNVSKTRWSERLWVTHEFVFGAGPQTLMVRFAAFQAFSSARVMLAAANRRRAQLTAAQR